MTDDNQQSVLMLLAKPVLESWYAIAEYKNGEVFPFFQDICMLHCQDLDSKTNKSTLDLSSLGDSHLSWLLLPSTEGTCAPHLFMPRSCS